MDSPAREHDDAPEVHDYHENEHYEEHPRQRHHAKQYHDVKTFLSWSAPGRPWRKKSREFYYSAILIVGLFEVILFLFSQYQLMLVLGSLLFLVFVMATVPPQLFHYRISSEGIKIEDHFYIWSELYDFYFKKFDGVDVLIVRTEDIFPGELKITLGDISRDHIRRIMVQFLPYREIVKPTFMEKSGDWLAKTFPLERSHNQ